MTDIVMKRGDTLVIDLTVTRNAAAVNLTGASLWMTAKTDFSGADPGQFQKTVGVGITITNAAGGLAQIVVAPADTDAVGATTTTFKYDIQLKEASGRVSTIQIGLLTVEPDVTRSTV